MARASGAGLELARGKGAIRLRGEGRTGVPPGVQVRFGFGFEETTGQFPREERHDLPFVSHSSCCVNIRREKTEAGEVTKRQ